MAATIKDVANEAGVSPSTVSRVIGGSPKISQVTKDRVYEAIKKLDYHPNAIARSLANNSTNTLGLVLPNEENDLFKNPFFIQVMTGISSYAQKQGYYIMFGSSKSENEELNIIKNYTASKLVDGIILLTARTKDKCIKYLNNINFPFVVVGRPEITNNILWVDNDNFQAMYTAVNELMLRGHKKVGFIGGPDDWNMSKDRLEGYKRALRIHGVDINERIIVHKNDFTEECGAEAAREIFSKEKPTAIVTTDDLLAFGVSQVLAELKLEKIALVGFNNNPLNNYQKPALSSIDINSNKIGYFAAKLLIDKLNNKASDINHYIIETNLVKRESFF